MTLRPGWTQADQPFNADGDGVARLRVEGTGFGPEATVFVAGLPMVTIRVSDRCLSATVPEELFRRPGVLPVWVDNHSGVSQRSAIQQFRVMSKRTVMAYRPSSGRWRRVGDAFNWLVWLASGVKSRIDITPFYLQHALGMTSTRAQTKLASAPQIDTLQPGCAEVDEAFNIQRNGRVAVVVEGFGFGNEAVGVVARWPVETDRVSHRLLTAHVPAGLFTRPGALSFWVDNRNGSRRVSAIRCFRVMPKRAVAADRPASGRWRWLIAAASTRTHLLCFYVLRALDKHWGKAVPATEPRNEVLPPTREMVAGHIRPLAGPPKPDIICFPIINWDHLYQRPQQILTRLAAVGHRVFYLSYRFLDAENETFQLHPLVPGVTEVRLRSPAPIDVHADGIIGDVEEDVFAALLDFKAAVGLGETICVVHLPAWTPLVLRLKADFGCRIIVDCLDELSGFRNIGTRILDLERTLVAAADRVIVSSHKLAERHTAHDPLLVPNATDYDRFATAKVTARASKRAARRLGLMPPVLGYYGSISYWFDFDLVASAAAARPHWHFLLIGRFDVEVPAELGALPNVHLFGEVPYEELPAHLATFDVCLIPFLLDDLTNATNPVKFFEYLSAGKPVVASRMPELKPFAAECFLYEGVHEFLDQVEHAILAGEDPAQVDARQAVARANTWDMRVDTLRSALDDLYLRSDEIPPRSSSPDRSMIKCHSPIAAAEHERRRQQP